MSVSPPVLDIELVDSLFATVDSQDQRNVIGMVAELRADATRRLERLSAGASERDVVRELHQLRGAVASFGLAAAAALLSDLELEWSRLTAAEHAARLQAARRAFDAAMVALVKHLPYLSGPVDK